MSRLRLVIARSLPAAAASLGGTPRAEGPADVLISLCDGESATPAVGLRAGQVLERGDAQHLAGQMMQKGRPLPENDPRLRAVEAYITTARKGVSLVPGKH